MSKNSGTGFWVIVGLMLVLVPVTLIEAAVACVSRAVFGRTTQPRTR